MTILNDRQIDFLHWKSIDDQFHIDENKAPVDLIRPFVDHQVRRDKGDRPIISYGLSSFGYDIRLSPNDFRIFIPSKGLLDPKKINPQCLRTITKIIDGAEEYFILPPHTTGLGVSVEHFNLPNNITGVCVGKSTYARCGIDVLVTPLEAGWQGYLTLEFTNTTPIPVKLYINEGCCQIQFFEGSACKTSYADRKGKYQCQEQKVVLPKV